MESSKKIWNFKVYKKHFRPYQQFWETLHLIYLTIINVKILILFKVFVKIMNKTTKKRIFTRSCRKKFFQQDLVNFFLVCSRGYQSKVKNTTCYEAFGTPLAWDAAQKNCAQNSFGTLVSIASAFENSDLLGLFGNHP